MKSIIRSWPVIWAVSAVVIGAGALIVYATKLNSAKKANTSAIPVDTVKRGPLTISVTVSGTIRSRQQEIIKSEVEGLPTILYLVPEGTRIKKGDLLVELDVSKLQDAKVSQQIIVQNADAAAIGARETLAVAKNQAKSDTAKAELDAQFAGEDLVKYTKGDYENALKEAGNKITLAEAELALATTKCASSARLLEQKFLSKMEYKADELSMQRWASSLELAQNAKKLLIDFTYKREMTKLTAAVDQAAMALERVIRKASADIVQAQALLRAKESELERQKTILEKTDYMIGKAKMFAPTDGLVVYASTSGGGFRGDREPLAEGAAVRERQEIIYLPTADAVMAAVKLHESSLDKVRLDLPVRVTVDAVPNKVFMGRVKKIAPLPDQQSMWQNPDLKVYNTEIWLEGDGSDLRTGMTCRAEIVVDYYPDAVYVPVHAVVRVGGKPTAYVPGPQGLVARPIEIGLDNNRMIRILKGLEPGEIIALAPPLADAAISAEAQTAQLPPSPGMTFPQTRPSGFTPPAGREARQPGQGRRATSRDPAADAADSATDRTPTGEGRRGPNLQNMTEEQRAAFEARRKQFEALSPEERQKTMDQMRQGAGRRSRGPETAPASPIQP